MLLVGCASVQIIDEEYLKEKRKEPKHKVEDSYLRFKIEMMIRDSENRKW
jgi:hypothetical protein